MNSLLPICLLVGLAIIIGYRLAQNKQVHLLQPSKVKQNKPTGLKKSIGMLIIIVMLVVTGGRVVAANFTSNASGAWTTGSNWIGGIAPPVSGSTGAITLNHDMTVTGAYDFQGSTLLINAGHTLTITGDFTTSNGATINVYGTLLISGNVTLNATLNVMPGGKVVVGGDVNVISNPYLNIGTNVAPGAYADMVIKGNLNLSAGKVIVEKNARFAVFKNITSNNWGSSKVDIKNGGQTYVNGNISLTGGGDQIANGNGTTPIGLYVNGTSTTAGNGASITSNEGTKATMQTNDNPFYLWVQAQPSSPLPIKLVSFKVSSTENNAVSLTWSTASEENFDRFIIEHSPDGKSFKMTGQVSGAGNSKMLLDYSFIDNNPVIGKNYYRLKSVDLDGKFEYSGVVSANLKAPRELTLYPNPSSGELLNFKTNFEPEEKDAISIIDITGAEVTKLPINENNGQLALGTALKPGTYFVRYVSTNFQTVERLMVK